MSGRERESQSTPDLLGGTFCDYGDCSTRLDERSEGYQVIPPGAGSALGADVYCSANCAKRALISEDETDGRN